MENITIWFVTDNAAGKKLYQAVADLGIATNLYQSPNLLDAYISPHDNNIFIIDLKKQKLENIHAFIKHEKRMHDSLKFLILDHKQVSRSLRAPIDTMHVELISRPVLTREFLILLEKSIIVEKYREIMRYISCDADKRVRILENLIDVNRKQIFDPQKEKACFKQILEFEKKVITEQQKINSSIRNLTLIRQKEMFDIKRRIEAEELIEELRRKELREAQDIIRAQESVIDYSAQELDSANQIIIATEKVQELGRHEAINLHEELNKEKEKNRQLTMELEKIRQSARITGKED